MNIEKMKKLKEWILAEPRRYHQSDWVVTDKSYMILQLQNPPCGTVACLAGNVCLMEGYVPSKDTESTQMHKPRSRKWDYASSIARKELDLTENEAGNLFDGDCEGWFSEPKSVYLHAKRELSLLANEPSRAKFTLEQIMLQKAQAAAMQLDMMIVKEEARLAKQAPGSLSHQA